MHVLSIADQQRKRQLGRMKRLASGLLGVVAICYVITRWLESQHSWVGYPRAFFEAAMVGALADWFAVTALFRHPLGLPIPHTAIIPNRKDQIGESLGEFVQGNFLTSEVLAERLSDAHVGARLGHWLAEPVNAAKAAQAAADALRGSLEVLDDSEVSMALQSMVERRIRSTEVAPLVARALDLAVEGGHHQRLLDAVLVGLDGFLDDNRTTFRQRLESESPWWIPESIDDRIFDKIYVAVHRFLVDIESNPNHEIRATIDQRILSFAQRLRSDPDLLAKGEALKVEILAHPDVRAWLASLWSEVKHSTTTAVTDPTSELRQRMTAATESFGTRLMGDIELQQRIDDWAVRAASYVVDHYKGEAAQLISDTVAKWDGQATSERMELQVGRDLQFIRINGTIVGGLAGLAIFTISQLVF